MNRRRRAILTAPSPLIRTPNPLLTTGCRGRVPTWYPTQPPARSPVHGRHGSIQRLRKVGHVYRAAKVRTAAFHCSMDIGYHIAVSCMHCGPIHWQRGTIIASKPYSRDLSTAAVLLRTIHKCCGAHRMSIRLACAAAARADAYLSYNYVIRESSTSGNGIYSGSRVVDEGSPRCRRRRCVREWIRVCDRCSGCVPYIELEWPWFGQDCTRTGVAEATMGRRQYAPRPRGMHAHLAYLLHLWLL